MRVGSGTKWGKKLKDTNRGKQVSPNKTQLRNHLPKMIYFNPSKNICLLKWDDDMSSDDNGKFFKIIAMFLEIFEDRL